MSMRCIAALHAQIAVGVGTAPNVAVASYSSPFLSTSMAVVALVMPVNTRPVVNVRMNMVRTN